MTQTRTLARTRPELGAFLKSRRERIAPEAAGLPSGSRRRTPGLRREEVAALAGVGVTWYTWLEQGRDIRASSDFLERLARIFKLDATERRHLFLLAHQRLPSEPGKTWCEVPPLVHRLMADLPTRPSYVLNLRWDVLAFNSAADALFGFSRHAVEARNLLWLLFTDPAIRALFDPWQAQARQMLGSFKRDAARAPADPALNALVETLSQVDEEFRVWWPDQEIHGPCLGVRTLSVAPLGAVEVEHISLTIDDERHLRLVYYAARDDALETLLKECVTPGES
ncbi:helix-turn-helix transcriptional regulator [Halomonas sp. GD1P12]|uniref:helix-turn-helix transcriptional regulator n=1 Tax=Halomonas sp. GD1P12 TaxID=2982691 RepID=UPI0021E4705C|nr:helix-turn-helix transcriptional regulator [Halomonas sp. GD1P12]UYG00710.1 helix-turn-helix transcriptional regulator [Halomonas sp. GD1P12]